MRALCWSGRSAWHGCSVCARSAEPIRVLRGFFWASTELWDAEAGLSPSAKTRICNNAALSFFLLCEAQRTRCHSVPCSCTPPRHWSPCASKSANSLPTLRLPEGRTEPCESFFGTHARQLRVGFPCSGYGAVAVEGVPPGNTFAKARRSGWHRFVRTAALPCVASCTKSVVPKGCSSTTARCVKAANCLIA